MDIIHPQKQIVYQIHFIKQMGVMKGKPKNMNWVNPTPNPQLKFPNPFAK